MARIEKTVFISYRRKDISWALAVYQYLTSQKYDVFFDYTSIPSGDFEQIIVSNIKARAHFVLILTPTSLDRCSNPGDWLRREIETAIDEKRNIIPLFFDGFSFGSPTAVEKLTGKLSTINRYNGLDIPSGYFMEGMERLRGRYLNIALDAVLHPVSDEVQKVVKEEQIAANKAVLLEQKEKEIKKHAHVEIVEKIREEKLPRESLAKVNSQRDVSGELNNAKKGQATHEAKVKQPLKETGVVKPESNRQVMKKIPLWGVGLMAFVIFALIIWGALSLPASPESTQTPLSESTQTLSATQTPVISLATKTPIPVTSTATIVPMPAFEIGSTLTGEDGATLLYVPAGEFIMGDDDHPNAQPVHKVKLDAFWIDQTEVTIKQYVACVSDNGCKPPAETKSYNRSDYYGNAQFNDYPVIYVSWENANAYCAWSKRRLPTEAEWEKAARGVDGWTYPWGNNPPNNSLLNYNEKIGDTTEVFRYPDGRSVYGAYDMAGNVWEWVSDWYQSDYYSTLEDGVSNPKGPSSGDGRVVRSSSYYMDKYHVSITERNNWNPMSPSYGLGFRCAMNASE
ncbi:MAG: SUMF1/EgtB/PvdO family nonheme iron enzyme [Anaerolineales bacterium]|nr:SUMF1/EgtB/PvdO family nonheme iron enzyme [Anaerolineales bacterium]